MRCRRTRACRSWPSRRWPAARKWWWCPTTRRAGSSWTPGPPARPCPRSGWAPRRWWIRPPTRVATRSWPPSSARPACRRRWPRPGGQTRAAGQQGSPGGGRFAIHAGHPRQRRRIAAHRQRAQRHFPVPAAWRPAQAPDAPAPGVRRLLLTASGGPFRGRDLDDLHDVTPAQACAHPNWSMGRKISVDSATMLNKGLEVIEAHWLFAMPADRIGWWSTRRAWCIRWLSTTMAPSWPSWASRHAHADRLWPGLSRAHRQRRRPAGSDAPGSAGFRAARPGALSCLALAFAALRAGQGACVALNAANEVAVEAFLSGRLAYTWIPASSRRRWSGRRGGLLLRSAVSRTCWRWMRRRAVTRATWGWPEAPRACLPRCNRLPIDPGF